MSDEQRVEDHDGITHDRGDAVPMPSGQYGKWRVLCGWVGGKIRGQRVNVTCLWCTRRR